MSLAEVAMPVVSGRVEFKRGARRWPGLLDLLKRGWDVSWSLGKLLQLVRGNVLSGDVRTTETIWAVVASFVV